MRNPIAIKTCDNCGKNVEIYHKERLTRKNIFCSKKCESEYRKNQTVLNTTCEVCGKKYHMKQSHINKQKHFTCSRECRAKLIETIYLGENNPNYGNKGPSNPMFKNFSKISNYGYRMIYFPTHPFADCDGFVREHRLIAEKYLLQNCFSVEINGKKYLSPEFEVHHIDCDKLNNDPSNLQILTKSEHIKLHHTKCLKQ